MNDRHCCFYCICFFCMLCCTAVEKIFYRMALNCATQWGNLFSLGCEWSLTPGLVVTPTPTPGEGEEVHAASGQPEGARRGEDLHVLQTHVCSLQCGTEVRDTHTCEQCLCDRIHRHSLLSPSPLSAHFTNLDESLHGPSVEVLSKLLMTTQMATDRSPHHKALMYGLFHTNHKHIHIYSWWNPRKAKMIRISDV